MDREEEKWLEEQIKKYQAELIKGVQKRLVELFKQALDETVYDYYQPSVYDRTYMLKESVRTHYDSKKNTVYVYPDINYGYWSAVDGRDVSAAVPYWVQEGHDDGIGIKKKGENQYHRYEGRHYLERAKELIDKEFKDSGIKVEIINEQPPIV